MLPRKTLIVISILSPVLLIGISVWLLVTHASLGLVALIILAALLSLGPVLSVVNFASAAESRSTEELIGQMPVALLCADSSGLITFANRRASKTFKSVETSLRGKNIRGLLPTFIEPTPQPGTVTVQAEDTGCRLDGTSFPVRLFIRTLGSDTAKQTLIAIEDLTQERELEQMKRDFMAMVSHDLRTPLCALQGTVTVLLEGLYGALPEPAEDKLKSSAVLISRLVRLIGDLLQMEQLSSAGFTLDIERVELQRIFEPALAAVQSEADSRDITFVFRTKSIANMHVLADRDRLIQVLVNLMTNALKYSPDGGSIIVEATPGENQVMVSVIDEGSGIPESLQSVIFQKYRQAHPEIDGKQGIGLGLAICRELIEKHGGVIGVESTEGKGSRFWFTVLTAKDPEGVAIT